MQEEMIKEMEAEAEERSESSLSQSARLSSSIDHVDTLQSEPETRKAMTC